MKHYQRLLDPIDTLTFNNINQDKFTANFSADFYYDYLSHFPEQCYVSDSYNRIAGYMIGKDEGVPQRKEYHIHVSAVTVAPEFRKQNVARKLMSIFEDIGDVYGTQFCDLFVRSSNLAAVEFYKKLGYVIYRIVKEYYGEEDAYDMRKALKSDTIYESVKELRDKNIRKWIDYVW